MAIDALSNYGGLLNSYANRNIRTVDEATVQQQDSITKQEERLYNSIAGLAENYAKPYQVDIRSRMADLEDVSLSMQTENDLDFLGRNSDLSMLDMNQAISDMKKDSILQDYQYFVGSNDNVVANDENGLVLRK